MSPGHAAQGCDSAGVDSVGMSVWFMLDVIVRVPVQVRLRLGFLGIGYLGLVFLIE